MPIMANPTPAEEEFANLVAKNTNTSSSVHPEDRDGEARENEHQDISEEDGFRNAQIDAAMRIPTFTGLTSSSSSPAAAEIKLPPASFDAGRTTGVKGVIADARAYEMARRSKWMNRVRAARRSVFGHDVSQKSAGESETDEEGNHNDLQDEETFLQQWRESRRRELESEASRAVRNRRTSPSVRVYGRFDEVDALGYLDAIEKVGRETVVVVFVYDHEVRIPPVPLPPPWVPLLGPLGLLSITLTGGAVSSISHDRVGSRAVSRHLPHRPLRQGALRGH